MTLNSLGEPSPGVFVQMRTLQYQGANGQWTYRLNFSTPDRDTQRPTINTKISGGM